MSAVEKKSGVEFSARLNTGGFRFTPQRQHVYDVLLHKRDHPTAEEVFIRAKGGMPDISMATVYNTWTRSSNAAWSGRCSCSAARRGSARTWREHCHYYCDECGQVFDMGCRQKLRPPCAAPEGFKVDALRDRRSRHLRRMLKKWRALTRTTNLTF
jgi:Fe2+ or Zn2+ uptake regulation protein